MTYSMSILEAQLSFHAIYKTHVRIPQEQPSRFRTFRIVPLFLNPFDIPRVTYHAGG